MNIRELLISKNKEVKAIIYRDERNNYKITYKDLELFEGGDDIIKIYKPTKKQLDEMNLHIQNNMKIGEKAELEMSVEETYKWFDELTTLNLKLDLLNNEDDKNFWDEVIKNPSELMLLIQSEIKDMAMFCLKNIYNNIVGFMELPDEMKESILLTQQNKNLEEEIKEDELEMLRKEKEIKEVEAKLKELEEKKAELMKNGK